MICRWLRRLTTVFGGQERTEAGTDRRAAFEQLFTVYFAPVYRYVRHQVPTDEAAVDVVHLVFYRLWTRQVVFDPDRLPLPHLCMLAQCALIERFGSDEAEARLATLERHTVASMLRHAKRGERLS